MKKAYTDRGEPIPDELLDFSKLPANYQISTTSDITVGNIHISERSIENATRSKDELKNAVETTNKILNDVSEIAKNANKTDPINMIGTVKRV